MIRIRRYSYKMYCNYPNQTLPLKDLRAFVYKLERLGAHITKRSFRKSWFK